MHSVLPSQVARQVVAYAAVVTFHRNAHAACSFSFLDQLQQPVAAWIYAFSLRTVTVTTTDCLWFDLTAADHDDKLATSGRNLLATTYYYSYHNYHEPAAAAAAAAAAGGDSAAAAAAASSGVPCFLPLLDCCCVKEMQTVACSTIST